MTEPDESRSDVPPSRESRDAAAAVSPTAETPFPLIPGQPWRDYEIDDLPVAPSTTRFSATDIHTGHGVTIDVFPIDTGTARRRQTWGKIGELHLPEETTVPLVEAIEEGGRRFEIVRTARSPTFRAWLVKHTADLGVVETLLRQIAPLLDSLHADGLGHLNVRPDTLFVADTEAGPNFMLGGLDRIAFLPPIDSTAVDRDPFYAPPESLADALPLSAEELMAWDWWALGRLVQESLLGKHVVGHALKLDVSVVTPDLHARAAALLAEKEPSGIRAGAVETMATLEPVLKSLLRGMLAHSPQGRWRGAEIRQWLGGETITDRYDLPAGVRLFPWKGRTFTPPEAAEFFAQEENWETGEAHLFAPSDDATALINFLKETPAYHADAERVGGVLALADQPSWQNLPLAARRTALASAAWVALAGPQTNLPLRIRGRGADWLGLQALFQANPTGQAAPFFHALTRKEFIQLVETLDASGARSLKLLANSVNEAFAQGIRLGLIAENAMSEHAQIFALGLESSLDLEGHLKRLRAAYASHRNSEIAAYFAAPKPERWMLVLLAYAGEHPVETGFTTHAERNLERFRQLRERADTLTTLVFWERLRRSLQAGPLLFSPWWIFVPGWTAIAVVVGVLTPVWLPTALAIFAIIALRCLCVVSIRKRVRTHGKTPAAWAWLDDAGRCRREHARIEKSTSIAASADSSAELSAVSKEIESVPLQPRPTPPPPPPGFRLLWAASLISILVALGVSAQLAYPVVKRKVTAATPTGQTPADVAPAEEKPHFVDPPAGSPPGLYEEFNDGFGRQLRGPLITWDVPATAIGPALAVQQKKPATAEQTAYALISGETLLKPYPTKGISGVLAVRVPSSEGIGLMLYDGKARMLASKEIFIVQTLPQERAWHRLDGRNVVYLGVPEALVKELAPERH